MGSEVAGLVVGIGKNVVDVNVSFDCCFKIVEPIIVLFLHFTIDWRSCYGFAGAKGLESICCLPC